MSEEFDPTAKQPIQVIREIPKLNAATLVAGDASQGCDVLFGHGGHGDLTRAQLMALAVKAELPLAWLPEPIDAAAQLGAAIRSVASNLYTAQCVKKKDQKVAPGERAWSSRWLLISRAPDDDTPLASGQKYGEIVLVASLYRTRVEGSEPIVSLEIDSQNPALAAELKADYDARIDEERYSASQVTQWIGRVVRDELDGVRYGGIWFVPRARATYAEIITAVFSQEWGRNWLNPPMPVASCAQLSTAIADGLQGEIVDVIAELQTMRDVAKKNGKMDIGHRGAETVMMKLRLIGERLACHAERLSDDLVKLCQFKLHDAMVELDGILGAHDFDQEWQNIVKDRAAREKDRGLALAFVAGFRVLRDIFRAIEIERTVRPTRDMLDAEDAANRAWARSVGAESSGVLGELV